MFVFVQSEIATKVWQRTGCPSLCTKRFMTYHLFLEEKLFWLLDSSSRQAEDISELHGLGWLNLQVTDAPVSPFHCHEKRDRVKGLSHLLHSKCFHWFFRLVFYYVVHLNLEAGFQATHSQMLQTGFGKAKRPLQHYSAKQ